MPIVDTILFTVVGVSTLIFFGYLLKGEGKKKKGAKTVTSRKRTPQVWEEAYWDVIEDTRDVYGRSR